VSGEPGEDRAEWAANQVIGAAIEVHRALGPGYSEITYELALAVELELRGVQFVRQWPFALTYKGRPVGEGRLDFLVEGCLVVELKAVESLGPVHTAQTLTYLRATGHELALLINFNVSVLKTGIKRIIL
jgi:GxxExxY protein